METQLGKIESSVIPDCSYPGIRTSMMTRADTESMLGTVVEYSPENRCIRRHLLWKQKQ